MIVSYLMNSYVRKLHKTFSHSKCFQNYDEIKKVVVLFDWEHLADIQAFVEELRKDGKEVIAYSFAPSEKTPMPLLLPGFHILNAKNVSYKGEMLPTVKELYLGIIPDTLIDLTIHPHSVLQILSLLSPAIYRTGFNRPGKPAGDMLLEYQEEKSMFFLLEQLHFYLRTLHSK